MRLKNKRITPNHIDTLSECEIFVFGSNLQGHHTGGAAKMAYERFGAEWGVGVGPTGQSYAIPTMQSNLKKIRPYVNQFIEYAKQHPLNRFLLTRVGCGTAGFKDSEMAQLFTEIQDLPNVTTPLQWLPTILVDVTLGLRIPKSHETAPSVIDENVLMQLCKKHSYEIGAGIKSFLPEIKVRYVIDKDKFGFATFGDFFFDDYGNFFVWHTDDGWMAQHDQVAAHSFFDDECIGRGYAVNHIFAGANTNFIDANSESIYTGDVLNISPDLDNPNPIQDILALSNLENIYSFPLDNHDLSLSEAMKRTKVKRIGTVFFQLESELIPSMTVRQRSSQFNGWYDSAEERIMKALMAKYTPNFDKEYWRYSGLEILGCEEFNWR